MGWASGTDLFDRVTEFTLSRCTDNSERYEVFYTLIDLFTNYDWDTWDESKYAEDPLFQEAFANLQEEWGWKESG